MGSAPVTAKVQHLTKASSDELLKKFAEVGSGSTAKKELSQLAKRRHHHRKYLDSCKRQEVLPNSTVLSWFYEAKTQKSIYQKCNMVIILDDLKDADFSPLIDVFLAIDSSEIDAVDIIQESHCAINKDHVMSLLRTINSKLRIIDLKDMSLVDDFFCFVSVLS
ncbi:hypothetical protein LOK49_LG12G02972 [Camellia lanceoleosa]|uniref:Uncharacterized protein n=1 Tax=Camellia lanceoleosa TaxID=1840588 RepID=A0ACC0FWT9_9ERIC|nr:hypothetical protein LOK49_LG12G02972 [Camellia lanceoleosa]